MSDDKHLTEHVAEMLVQLKGVKQEQLDTNNKLAVIDARIQKVEEQQARTNAFLLEHQRDILRIIELLDERVVHWGDTITIDGEHELTGVVSRAS